MTSNESGPKTNQDSDKSQLPSDTPVRSSEEDILGRAPIAHEFAALVRELDSREGTTVGVFGPWGHGKTSFINLMREQFAQDPPLTVVDFNPWLFSGSEQLVSYFFTEIGTSLNIRKEKKLGKVADLLAHYADLFRPALLLTPLQGAAITGDLLAGTTKGVANSTSSERSVTELRARITEELKKLDQPIIVIIDDIDRLTTAEIREIFKLVRLTGSFPNVVYVLAFDRERVEDSLSETGMPGRAYLEKIIQLSFDVPQPPADLLRSQFFADLDLALAGTANLSIDQSRWSDVYFEIIDPLINSMRDVKRYVLSIRPTIMNLADSIDLVDLLAIEAIRVFRPDLLRQLMENRLELTRTSELFGKSDEKAKAVVESLIDSSPDDKEVTRAVLRHVFPAALQHVENIRYGSVSRNNWRAGHRMAHIDFLTLYIDRVAPRELLTFRKSEKAFDLLDKADQLREYLIQLERPDLLGVIDELSSFESSFTVDMVVPTAITLLNLIRIIPENPNPGFFDITNGDIAVGRVILSLMRKIEDEPTRESLVSEILESVETYSSQLHLIHRVGHREGVGHQLVSSAFDERVVNEFVARVVSEPPKSPESEWDAWRVYDIVLTRTGTPPLTPKNDPVLLRSVIHSVKSLYRSQPLGSRHVTTEPRLAWDFLIQLFGSETALGEAIGIIRSKLGDDEVLQLADRYLQGWRPERF